MVFAHHDGSKHREKGQDLPDSNVKYSRGKTPESRCSSKRSQKLMLIPNTRRSQGEEDSYVDSTLPQQNKSLMAASFSLTGNKVSPHSSKLPFKAGFPEIRK